jgi:sugar phosphate isomerase/epimerase
MTQNRNIKFGTDLVTFYAPSFWGGTGDLDDIVASVSSSGWDPLRFWERVLDGSREAGLDGIEITFPPGDWHHALEAYGSARGFASALKDRGLELASGYFGTSLPQEGRSVNFADPADHGLILDMTASYAEFLQACDAEVMVVSLPLRRSRDADPPLFVDLELAESIAGLLNHMGAAAMKRGVKVALHPEAFSMFRSSRDVDLFMMLTDPTYVSLCPDTAQFTVAGSDPIQIVGRHRDRVVITHWKDAVGPAPANVPIDDTIYARQVQWFAPVGEGVVDWPAWVRLLRDIRYRGWALFELDTAPDPVGELKKIRQYVDSALSHIYQ